MTINEFKHINKDAWKLGSSYVKGEDMPEGFEKKKVFTSMHKAAESIYPRSLVTYEGMPNLKCLKNPSGMNRSTLRNHRALEKNPWAALLWDEMDAARARALARNGGEIVGGANAGNNSNNNNNNPPNGGNGDGSAAPPVAPEVDGSADGNNNNNNNNNPPNGGNGDGSAAIAARAANAAPPNGGEDTQAADGDDENAKRLLQAAAKGALLDLLDEFRRENILPKERGGSFDLCFKIYMGAVGAKDDPMRVKAFALLLRRHFDG